MNINDMTSKIMQDPFFKEKYKEKMNNLISMREQFEEMNRKRIENQKKIPKSTVKKREARSITVTAATKKSEIQSYITTLRSKIDEILNGDGTKEEKMARANLLQNKIAGLEKILAKKTQQEIESGIHKRKKIKDKVHLTKDDLTLEGDEDDGFSSSTGLSFDPNAGVNFDAASGALEVAANPAGESALNLEG